MHYKKDFFVALYPVPCTVEQKFTFQKHHKFLCALARHVINGELSKGSKQPIPTPMCL